MEATAVLVYQFLQTWFINGGPTVVDGFYEGEIDIGADDAKALAIEHCRKGCDELGKPYYGTLRLRRELLS